MECCNKKAKEQLRCYCGHIKRDHASQKANCLICDCREFIKRYPRICPFCGSKPRMTKEADCQTIGLWTRISCKNKKCKMNPSIVGMSEQKTIEEWNKRI